MPGRSRPTRELDTTPEQRREIDRFREPWKAGRKRKPNILEDRPSATVPPIPEDLAHEIQEILGSKAPGKDQR
jgi:hypothetical protein